MSCSSRGRMELIAQPEVKFDCDCESNNLLTVDVNVDHFPDLAYVLCPNDRPTASDRLPAAFCRAQEDVS
jgi:hypothetical protein